MPVTGERAYQGARVLISGGAGFIGSNLARRLVDTGARVTLLDNMNPLQGGNRFNLVGLEERVTVEVGDVRDSVIMERLIAGADCYFNLAGQTGHVDSMVDPKNDLDINTGAQLTMLETCRRTNPNIRIVFTSTRQFYGKPDYLPVDEKHPIRPVDVNGINKWAGETYHRLYHTVYGLRATVLRLTNTYGPRMRVKDARQTFLGVWVRQLLEGEAMRVFGDGAQLRDFTYVDDCVDAILKSGASDAAIGQVFNVGNVEPIRLRDLADAMTGLGYGGRFELVPFPPERAAIDIGDYCTDHALITRVLQWKPQVSLRDGLTRTVAYYKEHLAEYI